MYQSYFNAFFSGKESMSDEDGVAAITADATLNGWITSIGGTAWILWQKFKQWVGITPPKDDFGAWFRTLWTSLGTPFNWLIPSMD